jgi:hypothetical protein
MHRQKEHRNTDTPTFGHYAEIADEQMTPEQQEVTAC